jgi:outer membrane protein assembly factor BamB
MFTSRRCFPDGRLILTFAIALAAMEARALGDWGTYQGNAAHTGYVPGTVSTSSPALLWSEAGGSSSTSPTGLAIGDGTVFVTKMPNVLYTLDERTGAPLWEKTYGSDTETIGPPAYSNGITYVQTEAGNFSNYLRAYGARSGNNLFNAPYGAQDDYYLNPTPYQGNVYVGGGLYGGMYSFDALTGTQNWCAYEPQSSYWTPALDQNYAYSFTESGDTVPITGIFEMIDRSTGSVAYSLNYSHYADSGSGMGESVVLGSHNDAFVSNGPGYIWTTNTNTLTGRLIMFSTLADATHTPQIGWTTTEDFQGQVTLANGVLYVGDIGSVRAVDELTGTKLWRWTPPGGQEISGPMIATDNMLFVGTSSTTYAIDLTTHLPDWSYPAAGAMALSDNTLFIEGYNGTIYALAVPEPASTALLVLVATWAAALQRRRAHLTR